MARFIPKQFAENSTTSVVFGSHQEQGGKVGDGTISSDPATLQGGTAWPLGWKAATDNFFQIPRGEEMEGLERVLSAAIIQQFKDGLTFWQSEMPVTQYQTIVQYQTGNDLPKLYINITGDSTSTPPDSDTTNWFMFFDTAQVSANVSLTNSPYTTNRILEIPQDIKLELNNGTLTLKAGSKVYFPNGFEADGTTPKFDVLYVDTDKEPVFSSSLTQRTLFYLSEDYSTYNHCYMPYAVCSGETDTLLGTLWHIWFDTTNNIIRVSDDGTTYLSVTASLPLSVCTVNDTQTVSIDQVFNGFGYICSTVFVLPGVKVQIPNGRNEDGTCKNRLYTGTSVKTFITNSGWGACVLHGYIGDLTEYSGSQYDFFPAMDSVTKPSEKNLYFDTATGRYNSWCPVVSFYQDTTGRIISFTAYSVDSVANSNASNFSQAGRSYLSGLGMPSRRYIDLTLGASGATYTAPANGYFYFNKVKGSGNFTAILLGENATFENTARCEVKENNQNPNCELPCTFAVEKGEKVTILYSANGATRGFRFIYAEGEN